MPPTLNPVAVFGVHDSNLRLMERLLSVKFYPVDNEVVVSGREGAVAKAVAVLNQILTLAGGGQPVTHQDIKILVEKKKAARGLDSLPDTPNLQLDGLVVSKKGFRIKPKTVNQSDYIQQMLTHDLVFSIGPAGTGKTYLAVGLALHYLSTGRVKRVILTRPVVEAGESLGFLPGTLEQKINPYLKPLLDAIFEMLPAEEARHYLEHQIIEIAPLAYMRGRTLARSFIILDEGQNTSTSQMKMFLTRLGEHSKMVVTGDITQIDLPQGKTSGLRQALDLFGNTEGIAVTSFGKNDVVRHGLVRKIIETYERRESAAWKETEVR